MLKREEKLVAELLAAIMKVERNLRGRDENGPDDWRYADSLEILEESRKGFELATGVTSANR